MRGFFMPAAKRASVWDAVLQRSQDETFVRKLSFERRKPKHSGPLAIIAFLARVNSVCYRFT